MTYDWMAAIAHVATLTILTIIGRTIAFKIPALAQMRELNKEADKTKMAREQFRTAVKENNKVGLGTNLVFYFTILPFSVSFQTQPFWIYLVQIAAILLIFDFMYYLTHRFLFHGNLLRKVHALHHQARKPTYIDALYVHPLETFMGLSLFLISIPIVGLISGAPVNTFAAAIATLIFTQLNTINHVYTNLPYFPFKTLDYITGVHAAHHVDMNQGNYATLTMFYDKLFGTFEEPVHRQTAL